MRIKSEEQSVITFTRFQNELMKTRQEVAKLKSVPLDSLHLTVEFERKANTDSDAGFCVEGLYLEGAKLAGNKITLSDEGKCNLPNTFFSWHQHDSSQSGKSVIHIPFYFDAQRHELIASVPVNIDETQPKQFLQRGVAMIAGDRCKF